jgi:hypothetical protein
MTWFWSGLLPIVGGAVVIVFLFRIGYRAGYEKGESDTDRRYGALGLMLVAGSPLWKASEYDRLTREGKITEEAPGPEEIQRRLESFHKFGKPIEKEEES